MCIIDCYQRKKFINLAHAINLSLSFYLQIYLDGVFPIHRYLCLYIPTCIYCCGKDIIFSLFQKEFCQEILAGHSIKDRRYCLNQRLFNFFRSDKGIYFPEDILLTGREFHRIICDESLFSTNAEENVKLVAEYFAYICVKMNDLIELIKFYKRLKNNFFYPFDFLDSCYLYDISEIKKTNLIRLYEAKIWIPESWQVLRFPRHLYKRLSLKDCKVFKKGYCSIVKKFYRKRLAKIQKVFELKKDLSKLGQQVLTVYYHHLYSKMKENNHKHLYSKLIKNAQSSESWENEFDIYE